MLAKTILAEIQRYESVKNSNNKRIYKTKKCSKLHALVIHDYVFWQVNMGGVGYYFTVPKSILSIPINSVIIILHIN